MLAQTQKIINLHHYQSPSILAKIAQQNPALAEEMQYFMSPYGYGEISETEAAYILAAGQMVIAGQVLPGLPASVPHSYYGELARIPHNQLTARIAINNPAYLTDLNSYAITADPIEDDLLVCTCKAHRRPVPYHHIYGSNQIACPHVYAYLLLERLTAITKEIEINF